MPAGTACLGPERAADLKKSPRHATKNFHAVFDSEPTRASVTPTLCGFRVRAATHHFKERNHGFGNHSVDRVDPDAGRGDSDLAAQQELGLRAQWGLGLVVIILLVLVLMGKL